MNSSAASSPKSSPPRSIALPPLHPSSATSSSSASTSFSPPDENWIPEHRGSSASLIPTSGSGQTLTPITQTRSRSLSPPSDLRGVKAPSQLTLHSGLAAASSNALFSTASSVSIEKPPPRNKLSKVKEFLYDGKLWVTFFSTLVNLAVVILLVIVVNPYKAELSQVQQQLSDLQNSLFLINTVQQLANFSQIQGAASVIENQVNAVYSQAGILNNQLNNAIDSFSLLNSTVQALSRVVFSGDIAVNGSTGTCNAKVGNDFGPFGEYAGPPPLTYGNPLISATNGANPNASMFLPPIAVYNPIIQLYGLCDIELYPQTNFTPPYYLSLWDQSQGLLISSVWDGDLGVQNFSMSGVLTGLWNFTRESAIWFSCLDIYCLSFACAPLCMRIQY